MHFKSKISSCWLLPLNRLSPVSKKMRERTKESGRNKEPTFIEKQNHLNHQTAYFGQRISRPTKSDPFVQSIPDDDILANNIHRELNRSIRYSIFQQWSSSASFNELLDFSGSTLQATYGHLLIQASYSQSDQFSKQRSDRLSKLQQATQLFRKQFTGHLWSFAGSSELQ